MLCTILSTENNVHYYFSKIFGVENKLRLSDNYSEIIARNKFVVLFMIIHERTFWM